MSGTYAKRARAVACCLVLTVLSLYESPTLSAADNGLPPAGEMTTAGRVSVDGLPALSGQTFFSGSTFTTFANSFSTITLNNSCRIELSAETTLKVDFSDSDLSGALGAGRVRVAAPAGLLTRLRAADVTLTAAAGCPALFSVAVEDDFVTVSVEAGELQAVRGGETRLISAGELFSTAGDSPPQSASRQNLSSREKVGLLLGIGGALGLIALIVAGQSDEAPREPCSQIDILSGTTDNPCR